MRLEVRKGIFRTISTVPTEERRKDDKKMSSTGKTPKLGLNQWVLSDPFNMEDFNQDNTKMETAVSQVQEQVDAAPWQKLIDVTVQQPISILELNLSGIALSKYMALRLFRVADRSTYGADQWWLRVNKCTNTYQYFFNYGNSWQTWGSFATVQGGNVEFDLGGQNLWFGNMIRQFQIFQGPKTTQLATIDILGSQPTDSAPLGNIALGERFILMGVQK